MKILSDNGKEFDTVEECLKYESRKDAIFCFTYDNRIEECSIEDAFYVYIRDIGYTINEIREYISDSANRNPYGITKTGCVYKYNFKELEWENVQELISDYESRIDTFRQIQLEAKRNEQHNK